MLLNQIIKMPRAFSHLPSTLDTVFLMFKRLYFCIGRINTFIILQFFFEFYHLPSIGFIIFFYLLTTNFTQKKIIVLWLKWNFHESFNIEGNKALWEFKGQVIILKGVGDKCQTHLIPFLSILLYHYCFFSFLAIFHFNQLMGSVWAIWEADALSTNYIMY